MAEPSRDVFICHSSADKESVARPLADRLEAAGVSAWIDQREIRWGDSLIQRVNAGLRSSRYVIVILSPSFYSTHWPDRELSAALNQEANSGRVKVLPLLVGNRQERQEILERYPLLNDKLYMRWPEDADRLVTDVLALVGRDVQRSDVSAADPTVMGVEDDDILLPVVRRPVTQLERDRFAHESYREIRDYFERGLAKLKGKDPSLEYELRDRTADRFQCRVYANGERLAQCSIWLGSMSSHGDSEHIFFSQSQTHESDSSYNESLSIERDRLAWKALMMGFYSEEIKDGDVGSAQGAAKYLWRRFIACFE